MAPCKLAPSLIASSLLVVVVSSGHGQGGSSDNRCAEELGMASGAITDERIGSSPDWTHPPALGRLNNPSGAWCFRSVPLKKVWLQVDLGQRTLLSGFRSQGPPEAIHGKEYLRYVGLQVALSHDGTHWRDCCSGETTLFYADDRADVADVVTTHSFPSPEHARFIRLSPITSLRWIGHEEKCFRFEILGCGGEQDFAPAIGFGVESLSAGFVAMTWNSPVVEMPDGRAFSLPISHYLLKLRLPEEGEEALEVGQVLNTTNQALIVASPLWGGRYVVSVSCFFQDSELNCGRQSFTAKPKNLSSSCFNHEPPCPVSEHVRFSLPSASAAVALHNGSTLVSWENTQEGGWRPKVTQVAVQSVHGEETLVRARASDRAVLIDSLEEEARLVFSPMGEGIVGGKGGKAAVVVIVKDSGMRHAFVADVALQCNVLWSGRVRAKWKHAKAKHKTAGKEEREVVADGYRLSLGGLGEAVALVTVDVDFGETWFDLGGITMDSAYEVKIVCLFGGVEYACGRRVIYIGLPVYVTSSEFFVETLTPGTWWQLQHSCEASGGNLAALASQVVEAAITSNMSREITSFWCGGNVCRDSPAPTDSLWMSGDPHVNYINLAPDAHLSGDRCCIKVDLDESSSVWRGESCQTVMQGLCQFQVSERLDRPFMLSPAPINSSSVLVHGNFSGKFWLPDSLFLRVCLNRRLGRDFSSSDNETCLDRVTAEITGVTWQSEVEGLLEFSEYIVEIGAEWKHLGETFRSSGQDLIRTLPDLDVTWLVTPTGMLEVFWQRKVSSFEESNKVRLTLTGGNLTREFFGDGLGVVATGLKFGATYEMTLEDASESGERFGPVTIEAYPNCTNGFREDFVCHYVSEETYKFQERHIGCDSENRGAHEDLDFLWVVSNASRSAESSSNESCSAWSSRRRGLKPMECDQQLHVLCQTDLTIVSPAPANKSVKVRTGSDHLILDWAMDSGWEASYVVTLTPETNDSITVRGKPPITVTSLTPETKYKVEILTEMGTNWKEELVIEAATTANQSNLPEGVVGITQVRDLFRRAQLTVFPLAMVILCAAAIILALSGTTCVYPDNAMQFCFEISLIGLLLSVMLSVLDGVLTWEEEEEVYCVVAMGLLCLFSLCCFYFLLLEAAIICHKKIFSTAATSKRTPWLIVMGFGLPLAYTAALLPLFYHRLMPKQRRVCWLDLSDPVSAVFIAPCVLLLVIGLLLLSVSILVGPDDIRPASVSFNVRTSHLRKCRSVLVVIVLQYGLCWSLGVSAAHFDTDALTVLFMAVFLILSITILVLRVLLDKQIRSGLRRTLRKSHHDDTYATSNGNGTRALSRANSVAPAPTTERRMTPVEGDDDRRPKKFWMCTSSSSPSTCGSTSGETLGLCRWQHDSNALWRELAAHSPTSRQNRRALRQFRRLCSKDSYSPSLEESNLPVVADPPATYISPFGDRRPVVPDPIGQLRPVQAPSWTAPNVGAGVVTPVTEGGELERQQRQQSLPTANGVAISRSEEVTSEKWTQERKLSSSDGGRRPLSDFFSLPNTPDMTDYDGGSKLQLCGAPLVGGESYI